MKLRISIFSALILIVQLSFGQINILQLSENAVFYTSYDNYLESKSVRLDSIPSSQLMDVIVRPGKIFWGASDRGQLYRIAGNKFYRVEDTSGLVIYGIDTFKTRTNLFPWYLFACPWYWYASSGQTVKSANYFFSINLDSEIKELNLDNLDQVTKNQAFMMKARKKFRSFNYGIDERYNSGQFMVNTLYNKYAVNYP